MAWEPLSGRVFSFTVRRNFGKPTQTTIHSLQTVSTVGIPRSLEETRKIEAKQGGNLWIPPEKHINYYGR